MLYIVERIDDGEIIYQTTDRKEAYDFAAQHAKATNQALKVYEIDAGEIALARSLGDIKLSDFSPEQIKSVVRIEVQ